MVWFQLIQLGSLLVPGADAGTPVASSAVGGTQYSDGSHVFPISLTGGGGLSNYLLDAAEADYVPSSPTGPIQATNTEIGEEATPVPLGSLPYRNLPEVGPLGGGSALSGPCRRRLVVAAPGGDALTTTPWGRRGWHNCDPARATGTVSGPTGAPISAKGRVASRALSPQRGPREPRSAASRCG